MSPRIALVHTTPAAMAPIHAAFAEQFAEAEIFDLLESSLLPDLQRAPAFSAALRRRITELICYCERSGADAVLVTCSSYSTVTDAAAAMVDIPVYKADAAMIEVAVAKGPRIGLLATVPTAPAPAIEQLNAAAARRGGSVEITTHLCDGAFEALMQGDAQRHDELIIQAAGELASSVDVIALAQYSMARAMTRIHSDLGAEVLSSPQQAVRHVKERLTA